MPPAEHRLAPTRTSSQGVGWSATAGSLPSRRPGDVSAHAAITRHELAFSSFPKVPGALANGAGTSAPSAQVDALLARTAKPAADGTYELFKTTKHFDSTAQSPAWLG